MNKIFLITNILLFLFLMFSKQEVQASKDYWLQQIFYKLVSIERLLGK